MVEHRTATVSTHVLDTAAGRPAAGVEVALARVFPGGDDGSPVGWRRSPIGRAETDGDGRISRGTLAPEGLQPGIYELTFRVGAYFAAHDIAVSDPPFLGDVVVRFGVADAAHYHVPLLVSPWAYSTYRGS